MSRFVTAAAIFSIVLGALLSACGNSSDDDDGQSQLDTGPGAAQGGDSGTPASATSKVKKKDQTATAQAAASGVPTATAAGSPAASGPITLENPQALANGVQIQEIEVGTGAAAIDSSKVEIKYVGRLAATGAQFDATAGDTTRVFSLTALIPGFSSGMIGMKEGGKRRVLVPAALGYGSVGRPPLIPPNSDLVFDIELVSIKK